MKYNFSIIENISQFIPILNDDDDDDAKVGEYSFQIFDDETVGLAKH
jgi:hypothetical protein